MANISNVINVALIPEGQLAARDNMNVVAIMTSELSALSTANRYKLYKSVTDVEADFGTASNMTAHAQVFFSQQPNPVNFGGVLVAGYWRAADEDVAATAATLTGAQLAEATVIGQLQTITDGSFDIDIDGGLTTTVTGLNFTTATELADVVSILDAALTADGVTVTEDNQSIIFTSDTTGATSTLTYPIAAPSGTFVGEMLGLATGTGSTLVQGAAADTLLAETKVDAVSALKAAINVKGITFIDNPTDIESKDLATWAQANSVLMYDVFDNSANLQVDAANVVWDIKLSGLTNYRMLFSDSGNRKLATGYMARAHTVNFNAENSALTMNLKEIKGVAAESYDQTTISAAKKVGLDIYTTIKDVTVVLTSGANDFVDNRYNLIAFIDAVQTDLFNLLKQTGTKIPQTTRGVQQLVDQAEKTSQGFVRAGVFAAGAWSSPDSFGDIDVFNRSIETRGFYWLAGALADQPQADRQARKSPVLQGAVKNAGAIHSVDVIINFNL